MIKEPSDLILHKIQTYWPNSNPNWWKGIITDYLEDSQELQVEYIKPFPSRAYIGIDFYGWFMPYSKEDIASWKEAATHQASHTLKHELLRLHSSTHIQKPHD
jgi:hypothetical protein